MEYRVIVDWFVTRVGVIGHRLQVRVGIRVIGVVELSHKVLELGTDAITSLILHLPNQHLFETLLRVGGLDPPNRDVDVGLVTVQGKHCPILVAEDIVVRIRNPDLSLEKRISELRFTSSHIVFVPSLYVLVEPDV